MGAISGDVNTGPMLCANPSDLSSRPVASKQTGDFAYVTSLEGDAAGPFFFFRRGSNLAPSTDVIKPSVNGGSDGRWLSLAVYGGLGGGGGGGGPTGPAGGALNGTYPNPGLTGNYPTQDFIVRSITLAVDGVDPSMWPSIESKRSLYSDEFGQDLYVPFLRSPHVELAPGFVFAMPAESTAGMVGARFVAAGVDPELHPIANFPFFGMVGDVSDIIGTTRTVARFGGDEDAPDVSILFFGDSQFDAIQIGDFTGTDLLIGSSLVRLTSPHPLIKMQPYDPSDLYGDYNAVIDSNGDTLGIYSENPNYPDTYNFNVAITGQLYGSRSIEAAEDLLAGGFVKAQTDYRLGSTSSANTIIQENDSGQLEYGNQPTWQDLTFKAAHAYFNGQNDGDGFIQGSALRVDDGTGYGATLAAAGDARVQLVDAIGDPAELDVGRLHVDDTSIQIDGKAFTPGTPYDGKVLAGTASIPGGDDDWHALLTQVTQGNVWSDTLLVFAVVSPGVGSDVNIQLRLTIDGTPFTGYGSSAEGYTGLTESGLTTAISTILEGFDTTLPHTIVLEWRSPSFTGVTIDTSEFSQSASLIVMPVSYYA